MTRKILSYTLLAVILVGYSCAYLASSSLTSSVLINSIGSIGQQSNVVNAATGSPQDVQNAVNIVAAAGGGTVYVPAGTWNWDAFDNTGSNNRRATVVSYGGVNIIGAGIGQTVFRQTRDASYTEASMLSVSGENGRPFRISGITFQGYVTTEDTANVGVTVCGATDFRIDHCSFDSFANQAIEAVNTDGVNRGVIDHCSFDNSYKAKSVPAGETQWWWGYGIIVWDLDYNAWSNINTLLGKYEGASDIVYIEDCTFNRCRHAVSESQNGYFVVRGCTFTNPIPFNFGMVDVHGFNFGRGCEVYNNIFYGNGSGNAIWLRGGTSTVFNNTFVNCVLGVGLYSESDAQYQVQNTYIWGNTMIGGGTIFQDSSDGVYAQNVNYFLYARPNYVAYPYPHHLTL